MLVSAVDYCRYIPYPSASAPWGLAVTAAGFTEIGPNIPYPPIRHPHDHDLDWATGRKLAALQIVSIQTGTGWFDTKSTGLKRVTAGMAFLLIPGTWHRYRPEFSTGWTESWVEMSGDSVERLIRECVLDKGRPIKKGIAVTKLDEALNALHVRMRKTADRFDPAVTASAYEILAAWVGGSRELDAEHSARGKIAKAEQYFAAHHREPINMASFARSQGMGYSHFRKLFREHTGYAPWAYVLRLRMIRARRLILQSNATLNAIADEVGFSSAFHFSSAFKETFGESPSSWRAKHSLDPRKTSRSNPKIM